MKIDYKKEFRNIDYVVDETDKQLDFILRHIPKGRNIKILDAGCGSGKYSRKLHALGYNNLFAVDLFENSLTDDNVYKYSLASIDNLPYTDNYFDFIFSNSVIYYLDDPSNGIKEFNRCLRMGGILVFSGHTKYSIFTVIRCLKRFLNLESVDHLRGVQFRNVSYYSKALIDNGFTSLKKDGFGISLFFYPKFIKVLQKIFGMKIKRGQFLNFNPRFLSSIKSVVAYHFLLSARKSPS